MRHEFNDKEVWISVWFVNP